MRFLVSVMALGVLGCCFGPSVEEPAAPAAPPAAPSPLSQALGGMGITEGPSTTPGADGSGAAPPAGSPGATGSPAATAPTESANASAGMPTGAPPGAPPGFGAPAAPVSAAPAATPSSPACAAATAARDAVRAQLADLRMTLGGESAARLEAAGEAMKACNADGACISDARQRLARVDAYDRAKAAHTAETRRLAEAEVGLFEANQRVTADCGAP